MIKKWFLFVIGQLQKLHPGVAVSVKTRHAARQILNKQMEKLHLLRNGGILDDEEATKLEIRIETCIKKMHSIPTYIDPPPPEEILKNLSWIKEDDDLVDYIKVVFSYLREYATIFLMSFYDLHLPKSYFFLKIRDIDSYT